MKLLLDENLSYRLVRRLRDLDVEVSHVSDCGLINRPDELIWAHASREEQIILTCDYGFWERSKRFGAPPKVVLFRLGNMSIKAMEDAVRDALSEIEHLYLSKTVAFIAIDPK